MAGAEIFNTHFGICPDLARESPGEMTTNLMACCFIGRLSRQGLVGFCILIYLKKEDS